MRRLEHGYRLRLTALLAPALKERTPAGVLRILVRARARSRREGVPVSTVLSDWYERLRERHPPSSPGAPPGLFLCDASLGGLARWLRAAGHPAAVTRLHGAAIVTEAVERKALLVTSDGRVADRAAARGAPVLWVASAHAPAEQLHLVMRDLGLARRDPLCMACGGELVPVPKESVLERIPPRTRPWRDLYFLCSGCDRLFWKGTHWARIESRMPP